jgi:hypothetical protein
MEAHTAADHSLGSSIDSHCKLSCSLLPTPDYKVYTAFLGLLSLPWGIFVLEIVFLIGEAELGIFLDDVFSSLLADEFL